MLNLTQLVGFGAGGEPPLNLLFRGSQQNGSALSTYSFTGTSIGAASPNRRVVVCVATWDANSFPYLVTINGVTALISSYSVYTGGPNPFVAIASAKVPTGTTASISVDFTSSVNACGIAVYTLDDNGFVVPYDNGVSAGTSSTPSATISTLTESATVAVAINRDAASATSSSLTETTDLTISGSDGVVWSGYDYPVSAGSKAYSITYGSSVATDGAAFAVQNFGYATSPVSYEFTDTAIDETNVTVYTFTGIDIGAAAANRTVVVCYSTKDVGDTAATVTINGTNAPERVRSRDGGPQTAAIHSANIASGTTATIVVTMPDAAAQCFISVYAIYGASSATPSATALSQNEPAFLEFTASGPGVAIAVSHSSVLSTGYFMGINKDTDFPSTEGDGGSSGSGILYAAQPYTVGYYPSSGNLVAALAFWS